MTTVLELAMAHGLAPKREATTNGGEYGSACPFCGGEDRFRIWPEQNSGSGSYWCRQCGAHGDRIQFVMDTQKIGFKAACSVTGDEALAAEFCSDSDAPYSHRIPDTPRVPTAPAGAGYLPKQPVPATTQSDPSLWMEKAWKLVQWAAENLPGSEGERILKKKGIGAETAKKRGLGWIPEDIYRPRESWGLATIIKDDTGKPKKLWIPRGLVIPHFSAGSGPDGAVTRLRIRRMEGEPRYYVIPGSDAGQMVLGTPGRCMVVVESELDAILLAQAAGDITGILSLGTSHAKPDTAATRYLDRALCILVATDTDAAGKNAFSWWKEHFPRARRWPVPSGKDPSDAYAAGIDLRAWVIAGWPAGWRMTRPSLTADAIFKEMAASPELPKDVTLTPLGPSPEHETLPQDTPETADDIPAAVLELCGLLKKNPAIGIVITPERLAIQAPEAWRCRNESAFNRLSRLVYFDPDVFGYLHGHGAERINCENLLENKGR